MGSAASLAVYDSDSAGSVSSLWSGLFNPATEEFTFTVLSPLSGPNVALSIYVPSSSLVTTPSTPILSSQPVTLKITSSLSPITEYALSTSQRPVIGAFESGYPILDYWPKTILQPMGGYFLNFTSKLMTDLDGDDILYFILPNFGGPAFADIAVTTSGGSANANATHNFKLWWKQSETVSSGGVNYQCDAAATRCLKVKVTDAISAGTRIEIPVPQSLNMEIPPLGVPFLSSAHGMKSFAQVTSGSVYVGRPLVSGECSGFCDIRISYDDAKSTNVESKIVISFMISRGIVKGNSFQVTLPNFQNPNDDDLSIEVSGAGLSGNEFKAFWTLSNTKITLVAAKSVAHHTPVTVTVGDGQIKLPTAALSGDCATDGITMTTNSSVFSAASTRASSTTLTGTFYSCQALQMPMAFSASSITLNPAVPNEETDVTLGFTLSDYALTTSDKVVITVPHKLAWKQGVKTNVTLTGSHGSSFSGLLDVGHSASKIELTPTSGINSGTAITVVLAAATNHILVPSAGIYDNPSTFTINVETANRYYGNGPFSFASSTVVSAVAQTEVTSYTSDNVLDRGGAVGQYIDSVQLAFELSNTALTANSDVFYKFPGFTYGVGTNPVVTCTSSPCYAMDGYWDVATSRLRLRSQGAVPYNAAQLKYSVAFASPGLLPPVTGLPQNSEEIKISLSMSGGSPYPNLAETAVAKSPCIGICSVAVSYDVASVGTVTQFNLDVVTANPLTPSDELNMNLTSIVQGAYDTTVDLAGSHASYFTAKFTGTSNGLDPTGKGIFILKCTKSLPTRNFRVSIARSNALRLSPLGVPPGFKFDVNASAATNTSTIGPVQLTNLPTFAQPVGRVLYSQIYYDVDGISNFAGELSLSGQPAAIQLSCAFSSNLYRGEKVHLYLPGFSSALTSINLKGALDARHEVSRVDDSHFFSAVWSASSSTVTLTLEGDSPMISSGTNVNVTILDNQIKLPAAGILRNSSTIMLSTNAADGPVVATSIIDSPAVGSVLYSHLSFYRGANATKGGQLHKDSVGDFVSPGDEAGIKFVVRFNANLEQGDLLYLKLPGFTAPDIGNVALDVYNADANHFFKGHENTVTTFSGTWDSSDELLALTCTHAAGCSSNASHPLTFDIKESNNIKTPTSGFLAGVPHDKSKYFYLYTQSVVVPIQPTTIANVEGVGFENFHIALSPSPNLAAGEPAVLGFSFKLAKNMVLYQGDNITCTLTGFSKEGSSTDPRVPIHLDSHDNMNLAWFEDSSDTLTVRLNGTLAHGTSASFKISGLKVPTGGIDVAQSQAIACGAVASTTMHQSLSTNTFDFKTPVSSCSRVGYVHLSSAAFSPRLAGADTTLTFSMKVNTVLEAGESLSLKLPDFSLSGTTPLAVVSASTSPVQFTPSTSSSGVFTLTLVAQQSVTVQNTAITVVVNGLKLPPAGVTVNSQSIAVTLDAASGPITMATPLTTVSGVNTFPVQSVSFAPAESTSAMLTGGSFKRFKLLDSDNQFNADEYLNKMVLIGTEHLYVVGVEGNVLITNTSYASGAVASSAPSTYLYYPGYRPAPYYSGSMTETIVFKYIVQEGDTTADLRLHNVTDIELWKGSSIKRTSTSPTTVANTALPKIFSSYSIYSSSAIGIDTAQPYIIQVNSTKRDGNYGHVGEKIDILVMFSHPVSIYRPSASVSISVPAIELNLNSADNFPCYAYYDSGNNTDKLTFVYTIKEGDSATDLGYKSHQNVAGPSAMKTVLGANEGYIYRTATNLLQPANVTMPPPTFGRSLGYKRNIAVEPHASGKFATVQSVSALTPAGRYGTGHAIDLLVRFNENVTVDARGGRPYIAMDVGADPGVVRKAEYVDYKTDDNVYNHSVVFRYIIQEGDTSPDLNYKCTCSDYTFTTYIEPNGGRIINKLKNAVDYTLPAPSVAANLHLAANADIIVDTAAPTILSMTSPKLDDIYGVGESIEIHVAFTNKVSVSGFPRISIGTEGGCHAYYKSGNGTSVLIFEYLIESEDSYSMSDLSHSGRKTSLDLNGGWIKLYSQNPTTDVILNLPVSGHPNSLGYEKDIIVDTSKAKVIAASVSRDTAFGTPTPSKGSYLPPYQTIDVEVKNMNVTSGKWKIIYNDLSTSCFQWNANAATIKSALKATNLLDVHVYHIDYSGHHLGYDPPYFRRYMIEFLTPFTGVSEISATTDGCQAYVCQNKTFSGACPIDNVPKITVNRDVKVYPGVFDVKMQFDHRVTTEGSPFLTFETGNHNAVSKRSPSSVQYFDIGVHGSSKLRDGQFQLSYGRFKTDCIDYDAAMTVAKGSVKNRLLEIPPVAAIGVKSVYKVARGNGYRYTVTFYPSALLEQLKPVAHASIGAGVCRQLVPADAVVQIPSTDELTFRYVMKRGSRLVLKAKNQISKGVAKAISVPMSYGITSPLDGLSNDVELAYKQLGFSSINSNFNMLQTTKFGTISTEMGSFKRTSVTFSPNTMNTNVSISASFAYSGAIDIGENVVIKLAGFNSTCTVNHAKGCLLDVPAIASQFEATYKDATNELNLEAKAKIAPGTQVVFKVLKKNKFVSPKRAIAANSGTFTISTDASHGSVADFPVQSAEGIGVTSSEVVFLNPRPGQVSDVVFTFTPTDKVGAGSTISFVFEGFEPSSCSGQQRKLYFAEIDFSDNDEGPLAVGYDNDYFSDPVFVVYDGSGLATIALKTSRILYPRDHIVKVVNPPDCGCCFTVPSVGFFKESNAVNIAIQANPDVESHLYSNVSATPIGTYPAPVGGFHPLFSNVTFSNPVANEITAITFHLRPTMALELHDTIVFKIDGSTGTSVAKDTFDLSGDSASLFDAEYDAVSSSLTFTAKEQLPAGVSYILTVDDTNLIGVPANGFISSKFDETTVTCNCANGPIPATPVEHIFKSRWMKINAQYEAKIFASARKIDEPTGLHFEFSSRALLERNDEISVHLPGFTCPSVNKTLKVDTIGGSYSNFNATWVAPAEVMVLKVNSIDIPSRVQTQRKGGLTYNTWRMTVLESNGCKVSPTGFYMNTKSLKFWVNSVANGIPVWTDFTATSGIGFLSSSISFSPAIVSSSVYNELSLTFATSQKLLADEEITFVLPGLTSTESDVTLSGVDAAKFTASWVSGTSKLVITPVTVIAPVIVKLVVGVENKFLLPSSGVTKNDAAFKVSLESAVSASSSSLMGPVLNSPIRFVQGVGSFTQSQIRFTNAMAGDVSGVEIKFQLTGDIATGENVYGRLQGVFNTADLTEPLEIIDMGTGLLSTKWEGKYNADSSTITLSAKAKTSANAVVHVKASAKNALAVPKVGVKLNEPSWVISTNSIAAPVLTPASIADTAAIGAAVGALHFAGTDVGGPLQFVMRMTTSERLQVGDTIDIFLKSFRSTGDVASLTLTSMQASLFTGKYKHSSKTLTLTVTTSPPLDFSVGVQTTAAIKLPEYSIQDGESAGITATITSTACPVAQAVPLDVAEGVGFRNASLTYTNLAAGETTGVNLAFKLSGLLGVGEVVKLQLKDFGGAAANVASASVTSSSGHTFTGGIADYVNVTLTNAGAAIAAGTEVKLELPSSNGMKIPSGGIPKNDPGLSIWTNAANLGYQGFYPSGGNEVALLRIPHATAIGSFGTSTSVTYTDASGSTNLASGEVVAVRVQFTSSIALAIGDAVFVKLDGFGGDDVQDVKLHTSDENNFDATWTECTGTLSLIAKAGMAAGAHDIGVLASNLIKLPDQGLALNDARLKIWSNATAGNVFPLSVAASPAVGKLLTSSIEFDSTLGATNAASQLVTQPVDMIVKFSLTGDIAAGQYVKWKLAGFSVDLASSDIDEVSSGSKRYAVTGYDSSSANTAFSTHSLDATNHVLLHLENSNAGSFIGYFDLSTSELVLVALEKIYAKHIMAVLVGDKNAFYMPRHGIQENDSNVVFSTNAAAAPVHEERVEYVEGVGVSYSELSFAPAIHGKASEVTFTVNTTCPLVAGDYIMLNFTSFGGTSSSADAVSLKGHDGSRRFSPAFVATWNDADDLMTIKATELISNENVASVIISSENGLTLPPRGISEDADVTFYVNAQCLGTLKKRVVDVHAAIGAISSSTLSLGKLSPGYPTNIDIGFTLEDDMDAGDELVVHLEGFKYAGVGDDGYGALTLSGADGSAFDATWTNGDLNVVGETLTFPSLTPFVAENANDKILRGADPTPKQEADLTLPSKTMLGDTSIAIDTRSPPVILNVCSYSGKGVHPHGDLLLFDVQFSDAVYLTVDSFEILDLAVGYEPYLTLKIGTLLRNAIYKSGNGTSTLTFSHIVQSGDEDTNVAIASPHSLNSNGCSIWSSSFITTANLTVPEPLDYLALEDDDLTPAKLSVRATSFISAQSVSTAKADGKYLAGEVIDIDVVFDGTVAVSGQPILMLRSGFKNGRNATATYIDGSKVQTLDVGIGSSSQVYSGAFVLRYGSGPNAAMTQCIDWDTAEGSSSGMKERLEEIGEISSKGGVKSVVKSQTKNGNTYVITFDFDDARSLYYDLHSTLIFCEMPFNKEGDYVGGANFVARPPSNKLTFRYVVEEGDDDFDLEYQGHDALVLPDDAAVYVRTASTRSYTDAVITLPVSGHAMSLSGGHNLVINGTKPSILKVSAPSGTYGYGVWIDITVKFDMNVKVVGTPKIKLNVNYVTTYAHYLSGSTTTDLIFRYDIAKEDRAENMNYTSVNDLILSDGESDGIFAYSTLSNLAAVITLPHPNGPDGLGRSGVSIVDNQYRAQVRRIYSTLPDGYYSSGDVIDIHVEFTRIVNVQRTPELEARGYPALKIATGLGHTTNRANATYVSGSGTDTLKFHYIVGKNDTTPGLEATEMMLRDDLGLDGGVGPFTKIIDVNGKNASTAFDQWTYMLSTQNSIIIDNSAPSVVKVWSITPDGLYGPGDHIYIKVQFSRKVQVIGYPGIKLNMYDRSDVQTAKYFNGSGTDTLLFDYDIPGADISKGLLAPWTENLDYDGVLALENHMNGSQILLESDNPDVQANVRFAEVHLSGLRYAHRIAVNGYTPRVLEVTSDLPDGVYGVGEVIDINVVFNVPVTINGTGSILMETGADDYEAMYQAGNNTDTLVFRYVVQDGDESQALDIVDTTKPPFNINVQASMAFVVNDVHHCPLAPNPSPGQQAVTIRRAGKHPSITANYALPLPGTSQSLSVRKSIQIKTSPPVVTKVYTSYRNATYGIGERIPILLDFDCPVSVKGTPVLEMDTNNPECVGDSCNDAVYESGSGTSTLLFIYVVKFGDKTSALDYKDAGSLKIYSSWDVKVDKGLQYIKMHSTTPLTDADLTLPPPGKKQTVISPSSVVGSYHKLDIQTIGLGVADVTSTLPDGVYSHGEQIEIIVTMTGVVLVTGIPRLELELESGGSAHYVSGSGTSVLTFKYLTSTGDNTMDFAYKDEFSLIVSSDESIVSVSDITLNAVQTLPTRGKPGSLDFNKEIVLTGASPVVANVYVKDASCSMDGASSKVKWGVGQLIEVVLEFDQTVKVPNVGYPTIALNTGGTAVYKSGSGTKYLVFEYLVDASDQSVDSLDLNNEVEAISVSGGKIASKSDIIVVFADVRNYPSAGDPGSIGYNCNVEISTDPTKAVKVEFLQRDGTYVSGDELSIKVTFDNPVAVAGNVTLDLYTGEDTIPGVATYLSSGIDNGGAGHVIFKYTVQDLDVSSDLDYVSRYSLKMNEDQLNQNGDRLNSVRRSATYPTQHVDLALPSRGNIHSLGRSGNIVLDNSAPRVVNASVDHPSGEFTTGEKFLFTVTFDKAVTVIPGSEGGLTLYLNSNSQGSLVGAAAAYKSGSGSKSLHFEYEMGPDDEVLQLDYICSGFCQPGSPDGIYSPYPLESAGSCDIYHTESDGGRVCASLSMPVRRDGLSNLEGKGIKISREAPKVVGMSFLTPFSPWPYGKGQEIEISVAFDAPIHVPAGGAGLNLTLNTAMNFMGGISDTGIAEYSSHSGSSVIFKYTVDENDNAEFLDVANSSSLSGSLLRYSNSNPSIPCKLDLVEPRSPGSLSFHRRVSLSTAIPEVEGIIPLKKPGKYVAGEKIAIIVRFTLPVVVGGAPKLLLNFPGGGVHALYDGSWQEDDASFDILETDVTFVYTVMDAHGDLDLLIHKGRDSIVLGGGGSIMRKSTNPSVNADVTLRDIDDHKRGKGHVNGQWKAFYPKKVEVLIRDLWHEYGSDLEVKLEHGGETAAIFSKVGHEDGIGSYAGRPPFESTFGEPRHHYGSMMAPGAGGSSDIHKRRHLGGLGYDYLFTDMQSENLALRGIAKQSTTKYSSHAGLAIDGNVDGFMSRGSVTHTGGHGKEDPSPWWQVRLEKGVTIGGIRIWNRQLQQARDDIQVVSVVAPSKQPVGNYRLKMEYLGENYTSSILSTSAEAQGGSDTMKGAVENMVHRLGEVDVTRTSTTSFMGGYQGYQYTVTFTGHPGDVPKIKLDSTNFTITPDARVEIETLRHGVDNPKYNYKGDSNEKEYVDNLYPFWLMIFDESVPNPEFIEGGVKEALKKAVWFQEVRKGERVVNLAPNVHGQTVRVMLDNDNYLSLAEVEVYEAGNSAMSQYAGGSPIAERPITQPYVAEDGLDSSFANIQYGGIWTLVISDLAGYKGSREAGNYRETNGMGKVNDWVLTITDQANVMHRFYSDRQAEILTLPKYGSLFFKELNGLDEGYSLFNGRTVEAQDGGKIEEELGMGRNLSPCYGVDTTGLNGVESVGSHRYCPLNYGVGNLLSNQKTGAKPIKNLSGGERVVVYEPFRDFLGVDHFTFRTLSGGAAGATTEVRVNVKNCRVYEREETKEGTDSTHGLCTCGRTEEYLYGDPLKCPLAVSSVCAGADRDNFPLLCTTCTGSSHASYDMPCKAQLDKAVAWLENKGMCSKDVPKSGYSICKEEGTTAREREPFILYGVDTDYFSGGRGLTQVKMQSNRVS